MGRAVSRRAPRRVNERRRDAKLQLAEFLLLSESPIECARHAVSWLVTAAGARYALCAGLDESHSRLVGLAAEGLTSVDPASFAVEIDRSQHRLVMVLSRTQPLILRVSTREQIDGLRLPNSTYVAFALHGLRLDEDVRAGVLLVGPALPAVMQEGRWVASLLGPRLTRLIAERDAEDARRRLERERALLQKVIDAVPDPILLTDTSGRMLVANSTAEELLASREGESEGRARAIALNNMLFSAALSWTAMPDGDPVRRELLLADPQEGSDLLFELLSGPVEDPTQGTGIVSILRNVTDLRRATEEIEENYRKLRSASAEIRADRDRLTLLIDSIADPILVTDPSGAIVDMNAPAERLFTVAPDRAGEVGASIPSNDAHFSSFVSNLLFSGNVQRYSGYIGLLDPESGAALPFDATAAKVLSEHGDLTGVVTILHDRTASMEKERLYEELKRASDELEEKVRAATAELVRQNELLRRQHIQLEHASALKTQFLANMSHEFRTPLNAILGYTNLLLEGVMGKVTRPQEDGLRRIDSNARNLTLIIDDILDISRIEAGRLPLYLSECPVPEVINEAIAELEPIIARSTLKVTAETDACSVPIRSDRQKLKQIVLNLLSNALKFTQEGSVRVIARPDRAADEIAIAIQDTGIGIAPEDHEKVFEDFQQVDSSPTREYGGTGLGLAICRRLAVMLGGRIALVSAPGEGSTFTLHLPRQGPSSP
jgi:PAS domain S-box-containing protein